MCPFLGNNLNALVSIEKKLIRSFVWTTLFLCHIELKTKFLGRCTQGISGSFEFEQDSLMVTQTRHLFMVSFKTLLGNSLNSCKTKGRVTPYWDWNLHCLKFGTQDSHFTSLPPNSSINIVSTKTSFILYVYFSVIRRLHFVLLSYWMFLTVRVLYVLIIRTVKELRRTCILIQFYSQMADFSNGLVSKLFNFVIHDLYVHVHTNLA